MKYPVKIRPLVINNAERKENEPAVYNLYAFEFPKGFMPLNSIGRAMALSSGLNRVMSERLDSIIASAPDDVAAKAGRLKNWSYKKTSEHPQEVVAEAEKIASSAEFNSAFKGTNIADLIRLARINAYVHDIGRQGEIDLLNLCSVELSSIYGKGKDHAFESWKILKTAGVADQRILLPVRYHGLMAYKDELEADPDYANLPDAGKEEMIRHIDCLRDADKRANLISKAMNGMKGVGELNNPRYKGDYDITPEALDGVVNGTFCDVKKESHYLDAMLRWLSWFDQLVYKDAGAMKLNAELWSRTFEEAKMEFAASNDKNKAPFERTSALLKKARAAQTQRLFGNQMSRLRGRER